MLQNALRHLLQNSGSVSPDSVTESLVHAAKGILHQEFQKRVLFIWYDYFSVPQLASNNSDDSQQAKATNSIPAYAAKCRFFLRTVSDSSLPCSNESFERADWRRRGWCRLERAACELPAHDSWILVQGSTFLKMVGTVLSLLGLWVSM